MYRCKRNGNKEHRARFRFSRPDGDVYPDSSNAPDDIFPGYDNDEADEVHEKDDAKSDPLMVRVLIRLSWFPSVTEFNTEEGGCVRFSAGEIMTLTRANMGT